MKSLTIALATAKEAIRQPAFFVLAAIAGFWLVASIFVAYFTFGEDIKMYKDTGLTTISFACLLLALLTASSTVAEEIEGKTAITLLSRLESSLKTAERTQSPSRIRFLPWRLTLRHSNLASIRLRVGFPVRPFGQLRSEQVPLPAPVLSGF